MQTIIKKIKQIYKQQYASLSSNTKIRLLVSSIWGVAFILSLLFFLIAPTVQGTNHLPYYMAWEGFFRLAAAYVPILIAFLVFWFRPKQKASVIKIGGGQVFAAVFVSLAINFALLSVEFAVLFCYSYGDVTIETIGETKVMADEVIDGWIINMVNVLEILAPPTLACILGVESLDYFKGDKN